MKDTIVAISTALQQGAISIIRLSGDEAIDVANKIFSGDLTKQKSHTISYGMIYDYGSGKAVDEVLVSIFKAPKSFTTEDVVEINCHGGVYITRKILSLCIGAGARLANPGEFTQRAFLNGRIDLTQAESIMDLLQANNEKNAGLAINGIKGSVSGLINPLIDDLVHIIAQIEVNIDYPEYEDIEQLTNLKVLPLAKEFSKRLSEILKKAESGRIIKNGVKTVILGKPNVGKSSLLNALLEEDKAIVTEIAGTTRDIVEGVVNLESVTLHLIDTAGIRETADKIEQIGIEKSIKMLNDAELVIVLLDGSRQLEKEDFEILEKTKNNQRIVVTNKTDLKTVVNEGICISAKENNIKALINEINSLFIKHQIVLDEAILNNDRQIALVNKAYLSMDQAIFAIENNVELDLVTIDFQSAYMSLKEIIGEVSREDLLDAMFSRFCLGK